MTIHRQQYGTSSLLVTHPPFVITLLKNSLIICIRKKLPSAASLFQSVQLLSSLTDPIQVNFRIFVNHLFRYFLNPFSVYPLHFSRISLFTPVLSYDASSYSKSPGTGSSAFKTISSVEAFERDRSRSGFPPTKAPGATSL